MLTMSSGELPEDHLLARLGRDRQGEQGCGRPGVEVRQEAIDTAVMRIVRQ